MAMAASGYDWHFIDLEHGPFNLETATQVAIAALTGVLLFQEKNNPLDGDRRDSHDRRPDAGPGARSPERPENHLDQPGITFFWKWFRWVFSGNLSFRDQYPPLDSEIPSTAGKMPGSTSP